MWNSFENSLPSLIYLPDASAQEDNFFKVTQKWKLCFWNEFIIREYLCVSYCYEFYREMTRINGFMQSMWKWQLKMWCFILDDDLSWVKLSFFPTPNTSNIGIHTVQKGSPNIPHNTFILQPPRTVRRVPSCDKSAYTKVFLFYISLLTRKNYFSGFTNIMLPT